MKKFRVFYLAALWLASAAPFAVARSNLKFLEPYSVEGLGLGQSVVPDSSQYKRFNCNVSDQYSNAYWCTFTENNARGSKKLTIMHLMNNVVTYINKDVYPAHLSTSEIETEIDRLSHTFGRQPHIYRPPRSGSPSGLIATWGDIQLDPLSSAQLSSLAEGKSPHLGVLVDYLIDFRQSAKEGFPVYSLSGGKGFVWVARFDEPGKGGLRFFAADPSQMLKNTGLKEQLSRSDDMRLAIAQAEAEKAKAEAEKAKAEAEKAKAEAERARALAGSQTATNAVTIERHSSTSTDNIEAENVKANMQTTEESEFTAAVLRSREAYLSASNDLAKGGTRATRKSQVCAALRSLTINDWKGTISKLSSNSDGLGVLSIEVAPDVEVKTWNNSLSDISDNTLINPSSKLFSDLSKLKEGDFVKFSGSFFNSEIDCVKEASVTLGGSMKSPAYIFKFSGVEKPN